MKGFTNLEWRENPSLANRILEALGEELEEGGRDKPLPHLMELIQCLTKSYNNRFNPLPITPREIGFFTAGRAIEAFILSKVESTSIRGILEGVNYEVDFLHLDERIGELKSTRIHTNKESKDFPDTWTKQVLGYMKCRQQTQGVVAIFHIIPAEFKAWEVEANQEQIDSNWSWIQQRKDQYLSFVTAKETPTPFEYNEGWECKTCRYKLICDVTASIERQKRTNAEGKG